MNDFLQTFFIMATVLSGVCWVFTGMYIIIEKPNNKERFLVALVLLGFFCAITAGLANYFANVQ